MLTLDIKTTKDFFFDRLKVIERVDKDRLRFLRNAGGFARRTARNSMKRRGKARKPPKNMNGRAYEKWQEEIRKQPASPPGQPPFTHTDSTVVTLKNILFAFGGKDSVIVGPVGLNGAKRRIPALHEYGGSQPIREKLASFTDEVIIDGPAGRDSKGKFTKAPRKTVKGRRWVPAGRRAARPGQPVRTRQATYPARPYMAPAVAKAQGKFKNLWFATGESGRAAG
jgi:hypothetical protein